MISILRRMAFAISSAGLLCLPPAAEAACDTEAFPIAVDIGHTAQSPGATSAHGVGEFDYNLALGREVAAALQSAGFPAEVITVTGEGSAQLRKRIDAANRLNPRLLISIHHDSTQPRYLKTWEFNSRLLQHTERFSGFSLFISRANADFAASRIFATLLADQLLGKGLHFSTHHAEKIKGEARELLDPQRGIFEFTNLRVLKETRMPAVLLEAGIIVNRREELAVATPERSLLIADAVATAALQMCGEAKPADFALR